MWISTKTTVGFEVPNEYEKMYKFELDHPDWKKEPTTTMIFFTKELSMHSGMKEE